MIHGLLAAIYFQGGFAMYKHIDQPKPSVCWRFDICEVRNPYGTLEIGLQSDPFHSIHIEAALRHASSIAVQDHGINSIEARVRWSPFR